MLSKHYYATNIKKLSLNLLSKWKYTAQDAKVVFEDIERYMDSDISDAAFDRSPRVYWRMSTIFKSVTKRFMTTIYQLKGHAAPVESLFSKLSYTKPKIRNRMSSDHLKMFGIIEHGLKVEEQPKKRKRKETEGVFACQTAFGEITEDIEVDTNDFLQDFEELLANDDDLLECNFNNEPFILEPVYSYLEDLFDLQKLPPQSGQLSATCQEEEETDDFTLLTKDMFDQFL